MTVRRPLPEDLGNEPFRVDRAGDLGVSRSRLRSGDLQRPFRGIRIVTRDSDHAGIVQSFALAELCSALMLRMAPGAFFSHQTAGQLLGVPLPRRMQGDRPVHVGVVAPIRALDAASTVGHSMRIARRDIISVNALPLTSPTRTWLDLAIDLTVSELVTAGDYLVRREHPLASTADLAEALVRYPSRRGLVKARLALPLIRNGSESPRESALRVVIVLAGLPEPECNVNIFDAWGRFLARGDLVYAEYKTLLEYHGDQHRTDRAQWQKDVHRVGSLEDEGWQMLQFTDADLRRPDALVARLTRRLTARGWTPAR